jgi:hypothetical protein
VRWYYEGAEVGDMVVGTCVGGTDSAGAGTIVVSTNRTAYHHPVSTHRGTARNLAGRFDSVGSGRVNRE